VVSFQIESSESSGKQIGLVAAFWACLFLKITATCTSTNPHPAQKIMRLIVKSSCVAILPGVRPGVCNADRSKIQHRTCGGIMSARTKSKVRDMICAWSAARNAHTAGKYGLIEVTLTLPSVQKHDDNWIKRHMLNIFLTDCRKSRPDFRYYWVAETQENGNIHFHVLLDQFFDKSALNFAWAKVCQAAGYISDETVITGNEVPCTRVDRVRDDSGFACYLSKYVSKEQAGRRLVNGRVWGCSRDLAHLGAYQVPVSDEQIAEIVDSVDEKFVKHIPEAGITIIVGAGRKWVIEGVSAVRLARAEWIAGNVGYLYQREYYEQVCRAANPVVRRENINNPLIYPTCTASSSWGLSVLRPTNPAA